MPDATLLAEVNDALTKADAQGFQRGYAQAVSDFFGQNAAFLFANIFADAMEAAAARLGAHDPSFATKLHGFSSMMRAAVAPPAVHVTDPAGGATNVPVGSEVKVTFTLDMDPASFGADTFSVAATAGGPPLTAACVYDAPSRTATLVPANGFSPDVEYRVTVEGVQSAEANGLAEPYTFAFTTAPA